MHAFPSRAGILGLSPDCKNKVKIFTQASESERYIEKGERKREQNRKRDEKRKRKRERKF